MERTTGQENVGENKNGQIRQKCKRLNCHATLMDRIWRAKKKDIECESQVQIN